MPATLITKPEPSGWVQHEALTEVAEWTRFMASWCDADQARPTLGLGTDGQVLALYRGLQMRSVFQPIYTAAALQPIAFEGLIRAQRIASQQTVPPEQLFAGISSKAEGVLLDRLCRFLHVLNFERQFPGSASLYLNLDATYLQALQQGQHGQFFTALNALCPVDPARIILEITEAQFDDRNKLSLIVSAFKRRGYRVAIDDFGARHSNFDRLWALTPDIVKIDRELLLQAHTNPRVRRVLPKVVEIIHDLDAIVVCEGIETPEQHQLAFSAGVDLVQGFLFARPHEALQLQRPAFQA
jgi:EAL domain-containing protein (putative c-di-GMP-specific phosphodiesterase class I)